MGVLLADYIVVVARCPRSLEGVTMTCRRDEQIYEVSIDSFVLFGRRSEDGWGDLN